MYCRCSSEQLKKRAYGPTIQRIPADNRGREYASSSRTISYKV